MKVAARDVDDDDDNDDDVDDNRRLKLVSLPGWSRGGRLHPFLIILCPLKKHLNDKQIY